MNALLSIKPEFADKILDGSKTYEFRKTSFQDPTIVNQVILYASAPVQRIVGAFTFDSIIEDTPEALWNRYGAKSGIDDRSRFLNYFGDNSTGYAIAIEEVHEYPDSVDPAQHTDGFHPPMSFQYLKEVPSWIPSCQPRSGSD